jgi:hypothetical protein
MARQKPLASFHPSSPEEEAAMQVGRQRLQPLLVMWAQAQLRWTRDNRLGHGINMDVLDLLASAYLQGIRDAVDVASRNPGLIDQPRRKS